MKIGIIDCGGANLNSIYYSFKRINIEALISNSLSELENMDAFILPGVGTAGVVMKKLKDNNLINLIQETTKPTLGICIGMQIL
ncbi:imidazole glycerol phosphate synthase subunit HisH, partial [Gammaproteobacteria bacterium]|nr:imidazole glycerol phosphate synthase subunit HisH [Gammaproteobacteria bacterium]